LERTYEEGTIRIYLRCIGRLAEMMKADGITIGDLDEAQAVALVAKTNWIQKRKIAATFIVRCFIRFLSERGVGKPRRCRRQPRKSRGRIEAGLRDLPFAANLFPACEPERSRIAPAAKPIARFSRLSPASPQSSIISGPELLTPFEVLTRLSM
jgi:hypothetical protein